MALLPVSTASSFRDLLTEHLEDDISQEPMTKAVTLFPCGHTFNEDTVIQYMALNKLCPLDRQPIDRYAPNYTVRHIVEINNQYPADESACNYFQPPLLENNNRSPKETYIDQLLHMIDSQLVQNNAPLKACLGVLIEELMSQETEKLTSRQTESYKWFQKLVINNKVSGFVAEKLQQLIHSPKNEKALPAVPIQAPSAPALPAWVFGAAEWKKHIGDPGVEPPLPPDIIQRLPELSVNNVLVLIPETVNGQPLNLKLLGELVRDPLHNSSHATGFRFFDLGTYVDRPAKLHWAFLTRAMIEGSRDQPYKGEQTLLAHYSKKAKISYEIPTVLDAAVCLFMEYVRSGIWLYGDNPLTYTWCQEKYNANYHLVLGGGGSTGLRLGRNDCTNESLGVGGLKKYKTLGP